MKPFTILASIILITIPCGCHSNAKVGVASVRGTYPASAALVIDTLTKVELLGKVEQEKYNTEFDWLMFTFSITAIKANLGKSDTLKLQTIMVSQALKRYGAPNPQSIIDAATERRELYPEQYDHFISKR